jgi:hypothetical protein
MKKTNRLPEQLEKFGQAINPDSFIELKSLVKNYSSYWLELKSRTGSVEGKLHFSKNNRDRLIIFEPGFPGDGSTRLEKLWLNKLLENDFDVFAIRHNGTIINGDFSKNYLSCEEKQTKAKKQQQKVLGSNPPFTIDNWLNEPFIALESLSPQYKKIYLIGHSFDGLSVLYSLIKFTENNKSEANKIKRLISLAGTTGIIRGDDDPVLKRWREHIDTNEARKRIEIGNAVQNIEFLKNAYNKVHSGIRKTSEITRLVFVYVFGNDKNTVDEFIYPSEPLDILKSLDGNGILVLDKSEKADSKKGQLAHDMDNLKPSVILNLLCDDLKNKIVII